VTDGQTDMQTPRHSVSRAVHGVFAACTYNGPLGMTTGEIRAGQISASSNYPPEWDRGCSQKFARVYQPGDQAWCAKYKSASEWLQVDLGVPAKVEFCAYLVRPYLEVNPHDKA